MFRVRILRLLVSFAIAAFLLASCSKSEPPAATSILQPYDTQPPDGNDQVFDPNTIVDPTAFVDTSTIDPAQIEKFLEKTPYDRSSFLLTYQSNGVRASDAIARAARTYQINPLVFLIYAQTTQGLIGERNYPFPPERVEYVFGCGCLEAGNCLPNLAGFDRQVDCLGRELRVALDAIAKSDQKQTAAGWGPGIDKTTLDNRKVTPANDGTAVIYDHLPYVNEGNGGGSWVFWNVWNLYSANFNYAGPLGPAGPDGSSGWIGDPCTSEQTCGYKDAICDTSAQYPGGLCSLACDGTCPAQTDKPDGFCVAFPSGGFCFQVCNLGAPECRDGYECKTVLRFGATDQNDSKPVCYPKTNN
jgi:hypothetical protein